MVTRIKTHVEGLDQLIQGGLPKGNITMVTGGPGTGKSILCQEIVFKSALQGLKCLYISFEQNEKAIEMQMKQFGMDPKKTKGNLKIVSFDLSQGNFVDYFLREYQNAKSDIVCVDSIASLYITPLPIKNEGIKMVDVYDKVIPIEKEENSLKKLQIRDIIKPLQKSDTTVLLINQIIPGEPGYSRDEISEYLCDSLIKLNYSGVAGGANRTLEIVKMRLTKFSEGILPLEITKKGIVVKSLDDE